MIVGKVYDAAKTLRLVVSDTKDAIKGAVDTTTKIGDRLIKAGQAVYSSIQNKIQKEAAKKAAAEKEAARKEKEEKKNRGGTQR